MKKPVKADPTPAKGKKQTCLQLLDRCGADVVAAEVSDDADDAGEKPEQDGEVQPFALETWQSMRRFFNIQVNSGILWLYDHWPINSFSSRPPESLVSINF